MREGGHQGSLESPTPQGRLGMLIVKKGQWGLGGGPAVVHLPKGLGVVVFPKFLSILA